MYFGEAFERHGNGISLFSITGISKGVGFIRFDRRQEAEKAIEKYNGTIPPGSTEKITVKFANTPNSKAAAAAVAGSIPMALAASYLSPVRQVLGPIHHAAGRYRCVCRARLVGFSFNRFNIGVFSNELASVQA